MLSRAADYLYWLNRYIERAENVARILEVNLQLMLELSVSTIEQWEPLLRTTGDHSMFQERFDEATTKNVVAFLTFDTDNPNSIFSCLRAARENARSVRDTITDEMWEHVNKFYLMIRDAASAEDFPEAPHDFFNEIKSDSHLYQGITDATMSHGEGWHFGNLGRHMERADQTSRILDVMHSHLLPDATDTDAPIDDIQWSAGLKSASAFQMYRQRFGQISPQHVADFLVLDREFPRSVRSCVVEAEESLHAISKSPIGTFKNTAEQRLGMLRSELEFAVIAEIIDGGLHEFLVGFQARLSHVGNAIFDTFLAAEPVAPAS